MNCPLDGGAYGAIRNITRIQPWGAVEFEAPFENDYGYTMPEQAEIAIRYPGAESVYDKTIRLRTNDFIDAYLAFRALAAFTALVPPMLMLQSLSEVDGGQEILRKLQKRSAWVGHIRGNRSRGTAHLWSRAPRSQITPS